MQTGAEGLKWFGTPASFDPAAGQTVVAPERAGAGYWAGAPSAVFDERAGCFYLSYRVRRPLQEGRGWQTRIAQSRDGVTFQDVWAAGKEAFGTSSIERSALVKTLQGRWRLYVSYVQPSDSRWRIDVLEAPTPTGFDPAARRPALGPDDAHSEGVKDPVVVVLGGLYYMLVPYGPRSTVAAGASAEQLHGTGNVFTTTLVSHPTGLAVSGDGLRFRWLGDVLPAGEGWDRGVARAACLLYRPPLWVLFYDGRTGVGDVYEDRTGYAVSSDLRTLHKVTEQGPWLTSPWGTGALRYLDVVPVGDRLYCYYECARADGSHELRLNVVPG